MIRIIDDKFRSDARLNYLTQVVNVSAGFMFVTLAIRCSGIDTYGMFVTLLSAGGSFSNLISFKTNESVVRFYRRGIIKENPEIQYFSIVAGLVLDLVAALLLAGIVLLSAKLVAYNLLKLPSAISDIHLYALAVGSLFLRGTGFGLLTAQEKFVAVSILGALEQVVKVLLVGAFLGWKRTLDLSLLVLVWSIASVPFTLYYIAVSVRSLSHTTGRRWFRPKWVRIYFKFAASTFFSSAIKSGHKNLDTLLLGYFSNPASVGLYTLFRQFSSPIEMLSAPYAAQIFPKFVDAASRRLAEPISIAISEGSKTLLKHGCLAMISLLPCILLYLKWHDLKVGLRECIALALTVLSSFLLQGLWWSRALSLATQPSLSVQANAIAAVCVLVFLPASIFVFGGLVGAALATFVGAVAQFFFWNRSLHVAIEDLNRPV
jgi:hypothetical protein